jgi:D-serine deaminase-like pyridoxal phosphate-dependent protein
VTVAVDSEETLRAALEGGVDEVLIDVNVGLPRCGCAPNEAGALADRARSLGLKVRGVMGYEGHVMGMESRDERHSGCLESMRLLKQAHADVGGDVVSAGGTGTWDFDMDVTEIQAGSYALMDTAYSRLELPFEQSFWIWSSVISVSEKFAVADCGLKAMGMDHGNPSVRGARVWFCSDEHLTFSREELPRVGDKIRVHPAHVDPTVAYHEVFHLVSGEEVLDEWPIDLRGW